MTHKTDKPKTAERQCLLERGYPRGEQIECGICDFRKHVDGKLICSKFNCPECKSQIKKDAAKRIFKRIEPHITNALFQLHYDKDFESEMTWWQQLKKEFGKMTTRIVDSAEPGIIAKKLIATGWKRQRMPHGDYEFYTQDFLRVGITRKTISDLLSSINDKFGEQLAEMKRHFDINIILLEGNWKTILPQRKIFTDRGIERAT